MVVVLAPSNFNSGNASISTKACCHTTQSPVVKWTWNSGKTAESHSILQYKQKKTFANSISEEVSAPKHTIINFLWVTFLLIIFLTLFIG